MPSVVVDMEEVTEDLVAEKRNAKIKPSLIMVDNALVANDSELTFQDVFTTDDSVVAATGVAVDGAPQDPVDRLRINVSADACVSLRDELKDVEFLGKAQVARSEDDAPVSNDDCHVTLGYDFQ